MDGNPTLALPVETLARLALIAADGGAAFRGVGTDGARGAALCTISGDCPAPGL